MIKMRTFDVGFVVFPGGGANNPMNDETEFDVEDGCTDNMMTELVQLFNDFCAENDFYNTKITYISEVFVYE